MTRSVSFHLFYSTFDAGRSMFDVHFLVNTFYVTAPKRRGFLMIRLAALHTRRVNFSAQQLG
jgi:hypothetical protein